jgi:uncharacterized ParB-like nuclease family protein
MQDVGQTNGQTLYFKFSTRSRLIAFDAKTMVYCSIACYKIPNLLRLLCYLSQGPSGNRIKATIQSMDLPYNTQDDCYHWIEFRDYLIGDKGKE